MKPKIGKKIQALLSLLVSLAIIFGILDFDKTQANTLSPGTALRVNNIAPAFSVAPHEEPLSDGTTPTNAGDNVTIKATAVDANYWYLAVCQTNEIATSSDAAPTCPGGEWAISEAASSSQEASVTYPATTTDSESNIWYAFACDKTSASPACSAMSNSGTSGNNGSPFEVNHRPAFTEISIADNTLDPGATTTISAVVGDADVSNATDTVSLYVCKDNDFANGACGAAGTWCTASSTVGESWGYRKQISLTGQSGAGTNYQIKLLIGETSGATGENFDLGGHATNFPNDIKFTDNDGTTNLDYYVESTAGATPNQLATVWVEVTDNLDSNQNIYIYYGKSGQSSSSNGPNTFIFFDDFELNNFSRWDTAQSSWSIQSTVKAEGTYAAMATNGGSNRILSKSVSPGRSVLFRAKARRESSSGEWVAPIFNPTTPSNATIYAMNMTYYGKFQYYVNSGDYVDFPTPTAYSAATWYTVETAIDNENQLFRWWIDGNSKGSAALKDGAGNLIGTTSYINLARSFNDSNSTVYYMDQYWVRAFTATEPAYSSAGNEEATNHYSLSCDLTVPNPQAAGTVNYYAYVIDSHSLQASGGQQGIQNTFTVNNVLPAFSVAPHEDPLSDGSNPTDVGSNLTIKATASDSNSGQWYLAVCKTNAIATTTDGAPTCPGGEWGISGATDSGSEAIITYQATTTDAESNPWYAFACDKTAASPQCSAMSNSGTSGNNGSSFSVNHRPAFTSVSAENGNPGATDLTISAVASDTDIANATDTITMYACKSNDFTGTGCGAAGSWCTATSTTGGSWNYRKQISLTGQSGAGTNYQVKLLIGETSGATGENFDLAGHAANFPNDIKFTASDGTTNLDFWVESTTGTTPNQLATVWVEVAANLDSNQNIYIYYGKSGQSSLSNGNNTFLFFDDFNDGSLDTNKWVAPTVADYTGYAETGGKLNIYIGTQGKIQIYGGYNNLVALNSRNITNTAWELYMTSWRDNTEDYREYYGIGPSWIDSSNYWVVGGRHMKVAEKYCYYTTGTTCTATYESGTWDGSLTSYELNSVMTSASNTYFYQNNSLKYTDSRRLANTATPRALLQLGNAFSQTSWGELTIDYARLRKWLATEPAYSGAGSEEATNHYLLSCDLTVPNPQTHGSVNYYAYVIDNHNLQASDSQQGAANTFTVNDLPPTISGTPTLNNAAAIDLTAEKSTTDIYIRGVVTDDNGCSDINAASTTADAWLTSIGRSACDSSSETNNNNCYPRVACAYDAAIDSCGADDKTGGYECTVSFQYYANPTDTNTPWSASTWTGTLVPADGQGTNAAGEVNTAAQEMNSFLALGLADGYNSIAYGTLSANDYNDPLLERTRIEAAGNCSLDVNLSGTAMTGPGTAIPIANQRYGLGDTAPAWSAGTALSGTPALTHLNACKSGYTATPESKRLWWGIQIPSGQTVGDYTGSNTITAVKNGWASPDDWCEVP